MHKSSVTLHLSICLALSLACAGCGTVRTMPELGTYGRPQVYSGTRLDLSAVREDQAGLDRFKAKPPAHPLLDLPFSTILDTLILPVVLPAAAYEYVFE
jgi:uncharacterized protein YceK